MEQRHNFITSFFCRVEPWSEKSQATPTAVDIVTESEGKLLLLETI